MPTSPRRVGRPPGTLTVPTADSINARPAWARALLEARTRAGMTLENLALLLRTSRTSIQEAEAGKPGLGSDVRRRYERWAAKIPPEGGDPGRCVSFSDPAIWLDHIAGVHDRCTKGGDPVPEPVRQIYSPGYLERKVARDALKEANRRAEVPLSATVYAEVTEGWPADQIEAVMDRLVEKGFLVAISDGFYKLPEAVVVAQPQTETAP